jgi:peptide/nickel transport system ATP-binding protein
MSLLVIKNLKVYYDINGKILRALDGVDFQVNEHEFIAIVGESGSGKSTLALSIIGLLPSPSDHMVEGAVIYNSVELLKLNNSEMSKYRGTEIAIVFQNPQICLNPLHKIGEQISEAITIRESRKNGLNSHMSNSLIKEEIQVLLRRVRFVNPELVIKQYPFELSGGMCQRVMVAMALSQHPKLLLADEPTTALDVTTQAEVLKLMRELVTELSTSVMLITHDLAVASQVANRVIVMYAGKILEDADVFTLFSNPLHPYTRGLIACIPRGSKNDTILMPIQGIVSDLTKLMAGCRYAPRYPVAFDICNKVEPLIVEITPNHKVACHLYVK